MNESKRWTKAAGAVAVVVLLLALVLSGCGETEEAVPRSYSCAVYTEQGCAKYVVASGGELEVQSGGTIDIQDGSTVTFDGGMDLNGAALTIDADADTTLVASDDDVVSMTVGAAAGYFDVLTGNLKVGDGTPDTSLDGEDAYVEGTFEVDGAVNIDGAVDLASTLTVAGNISDGDSAVTIADNAMVDGAADAVQLTVQGNGTQTNNTFVVEQSDGTDRFVVDDNGQATFSPQADSDSANYDYWVTISGEMTGVTTKDRNYGLYVEMTRPAGQEVGSGDFDEAGIKVRVDTEAVTTTAGTVLRGIDVEAKADNPDGTVTNLYGGALTAKSDTSAGAVGTMIALQTNVQANAQVDDAFISADLRTMRQSANEPTEEGVLRVRNGNTVGTGVDYAISIQSDGSGDYDDFDYCVDMSLAEVNTADIRFSNGTTLGETVDTVLTFSEFLAAAEQTAVALGDGETITPTGTYQPLTSSGAVTTSATTAIADGTVNGQLLILVNENASDTIIVKDSANTHLTGDVTLGNDDTLMLLWDGADWLAIGGENNS